MRLVKRLSSLEMESLTQAQILDETLCVSLHTNTLGKGMNPSFLTVAMGK